MSKITKFMKYESEIVLKNLVLLDTLDFNWEHFNIGYTVRLNQLPKKIVRNNAANEKIENFLICIA